MSRQLHHVASTHVIKNDSTLRSMSTGAFSDRPLRKEISTTPGRGTARRVSTGRDTTPVKAIDGGERRRRIRG